mgnify:CR=1 FL=1
MAEAVRPLRRQYLVAVGLFALLLVASFALFANLLVDHFSRSYLEDVLLSGRAHAEELARQLGEDAPLYKVVEKRQEALSRISATLARQDVIQTAQVYDERGRLVWSTTTRTEGLVGGFPDASAELLPAAPDKVVETGTTYEIRVPLNDVGTVVVGISKATLAPRIAILRRRLLLHTAIAGGVALAVLAAAVAFIWHLVQRNAALEARKRMDEELAALGSLAANLAHEIRNPLNALSLNLELLEEELGGGSAEEGTVGLARREVGRLTRLVNDFLIYARPSPPRREPCALEEVLREVAALLGPSCERAGVELTVTAVPTVVEADRGQISQVVLNLAFNALQAMESSAQRRLELRCAPGAGGAVVEVLDSGPGIPPDKLAHVREAFVSLRKGGTGLGLAIADRIVKAHGGTLTLENRREGGLAARLVLPAAVSNEAA